MRIQINEKMKFLVTSVIVVVLSLGVLALISRPHAIQAANERTALKSLFENVKQKIENEEGFLVAVRFETPLVDNENVWVIPDYRVDVDDEVSIVLGEIADEYVCFDTLRGAARFLECTPYTNIVGVSYLIN